MSALNILQLIVGPLIAAVVSYYIFVRLASRERKRDRALSLLEKFLTDEHFIRARMVSHKYLLANPSHPHYARFLGKSFDQVHAELELSNSEEDRAAHALIRAIPSFFLLVAIAEREGYIPRSTKLFSGVYAYFWFYIIEPRKPPRKDPLYEKHDWMLHSSDVDRIALQADKEIYMS